MAEQGVGEEGLQQGASDGVTVGAPGEQSPMLNPNGEVVDSTVQMQGPTAGMEAKAEQGVGEDEASKVATQTDLQNVVTDYQEMVPNSYLRDPMSVSEGQRPVAENRAKSSAAPAMLR